MAHLSLTKRGYIVKKKNLTERDIRKIERDLTFQPIVNAAFRDLTKPKKFCTYLESKLRYYLPRYYGVANFGEPVIDKLADVAEDIEYDVYWGLLPHQELAWSKLDETFIQKKQGGILSVPCGYGKCMGKDTPIMMLDGSFKMVQDIEPGEQLMGDDSTPRTVLSTCAGQEMLYKVIPKKGDPYIVNESHILSLKCNNSCNLRGQYYEKGDVVDIPLTEYLKMNDSNLVGYRVPVSFQHINISVDDYSYDKCIPDEVKYNSKEVGEKVLKKLLINDEFSSKEERLVDDVIFVARSCGYEAYKESNGIIFSTKISKSDLTIAINVEKLEVGDYYGFTLDGNGRYLLGDFQVTHNTFMAIRLGSFLKKKMLVIVHKEFLLRQWKEAIEKCSNASVGIIQRNKVDVEGKDIVIGMLQSISMKEYPEEIFEKFGYVVVDECFPYNQNVVTDKGPIPIGELYDMWERSKLEELPLVESYDTRTGSFRYRKITHAWQRCKKELISLRFEKGSPIECTPDHLFLMTSGEWRRAKNIKIGETIMCNGKNAILRYLETGYGKLKSKKIIPSVDDNEFWVYDLEVEEDHNFIVCDPKSKVGLVAHNCHHISSEVFSRSLPKIACQYTLGLSATPVRRDGLTEVFLNYLGPFLHRERRTNNNKVWIKFIEVASMSESFDIEVNNFTGTKDTGKMITNISQFGSMNRLILEICRILVSSRDRPRKVLVLGARRQQLEWLHNAWEEAAYLNASNRIATGGLYYGNQGMNKKEYWKMLDESAKCDVIWGTMDIAKEGLDIPDRNTLLLLNGGHDVEQAVGRILRKFHETTPPTVIDLVYKTGNFQRHSNSRRDYYESEDYYMQKINLSIEDDVISVDKTTEQLTNYINHYPEEGEKDKTHVKRRTKWKKLDEVPLGNHPPELQTIKVDTNAIKNSSSAVDKGCSNKSLSSISVVAIPVERDSRKKKDDSKWEGQYDSDDERDLLERGMEQGHLCLLDSDDEVVEKCDKRRDAVELDVDGNFMITSEPVETTIGSNISEHETAISMPKARNTSSYGPTGGIPVSEVSIRPRKSIAKSRQVSISVSSDVVMGRPQRSMRGVKSIPTE